MKKEVKKYIKKPIVVEAIQLTEELALEHLDKFVVSDMIFDKFSVYGDYNAKSKKVYSAYCFIENALGEKKKVVLNDWIIKHKNGTFSSCKIDVFEQIYEEYEVKRGDRGTNDKQKNIFRIKHYVRHMDYT